MVEKLIKERGKALTELDLVAVYRACTGERLHRIDVIVVTSVKACIH